MVFKMYCFLDDVDIVDVGGKDLGFRRNGCDRCVQAFYLLHF